MPMLGPISHSWFKAQLNKKFFYSIFTRFFSSSTSRTLVVSQLAQSLTIALLCNILQVVMTNYSVSS